MARLPSFNARQWLAATLLLVTSVALSLIVAEATLRLVFEPVDYLMPNLISDKILRHKVEPYSGGHDSWGFRNRSVPEKADIVAIGDSLTYGVSASAANSWPATLQRLSHQSVYNLALGGYGPVDYSYLLESKAVLLNPSSVIVGFYFGNDIKDAFNMAYRKDYWKSLRTPEFAAEPDEPQNQSGSDDGVFLGSLRDYLARHSILYRTAMLSFGEMFRFLEMKYVSEDDVTIFEEPELGVRTGFTPVGILSAMKLDDPKVKEGLRISLELLLKMDRLCKSKGIRFHVVLLPTKETVFSKYIDRDGSHLRNQDAIHELLQNERQAAELMRQYFDENSIAYIDVLEPLRDAIGKQPIYPSNQDGHPNKNGYEIVAKTVLAQLNNE